MRPFVLAALLLAGPALAQQAALPGAAKPPRSLGPGIVSKNAPVNGILTLYGNERCPTDTAGNEIVVCVRRNAAEQYRVPKELREFQVTPENAAWAAKAQATLDTGVGSDSINSCSAVGAAGAGGCEVAASRAWKQERQAQKAADARIPSRPVAGSGGIDCSGLTPASRKIVGWASATDPPRRMARSARPCRFDRAAA